MGCFRIIPENNVRPDGVVRVTSRRGLQVNLGDAEKKKNRDLFCAKVSGEWLTEVHVSGILELGNVWFFVQFIFGPNWPLNQLNKNPNIALL